MLLTPPALRRVYYTCAEFRITSMRGLIGSSIQGTLSSRLFSPTSIIRAQVPYVIHTKIDTVRFQRTYWHGCFATFVIRVPMPHHEYAKGYVVLFGRNLFPRLSAVHAALNAWVSFL